MQLEDYFEFDLFDFEDVGKVEKIRIKGSRIGIEHILEDYLAGESPERIYQAYRHSLSLEEIYATITYYLHNRAKVEEYLKRGNEIADYYYQESLKKAPPEVIKRLKTIVAEKRNLAGKS